MVMYTVRDQASGRRCAVAYESAVDGSAGYKDQKEEYGAGSGGGHDGEGERRVLCLKFFILMDLELVDKPRVIRVWPATTWTSVCDRYFAIAGKNECFTNKYSEFFYFYIRIWHK